eukprot:tig00020875_g14887.t1
MSPGRWRARPAAVWALLQLLALCIAASRSSFTPVPIDVRALASELPFVPPLVFAADPALDGAVHAAASRAPGTSLVYVVTMHPFTGSEMELNWGEALDMLANCLESARRASVRNVLVFTSSPDVIPIARERGAVAYFDDLLAAAGPQPFDHQDVFKFRHAAAVLVRGYDAVIVDIDVAFLRDPTPFFRARTHAVEFMGEPSTNELNVGFMYARSEPAVVGLLLDVAETLVLEVPQGERPADGPGFRSGQAIMADVLRGRAFGVSGLAWGLQIPANELPLMEFAESEFFFVARRSQRAGVRPYVAHANGQPLKHGGKKFVLRNEGLWFVDSPSYYEGRFLSYALDGPEEELTWDDHVDALRGMLRLAEALNRSLVLPRFPCRHHPLSEPWGMADLCLPTAYLASSALLAHFPSVREATIFEHPNGPGRPPASRPLRLACPGGRPGCALSVATVRAADEEAPYPLLQVQLQRGVRLSADPGAPQAEEAALLARLEAGVSCLQHHLIYVAVRIFGRRWPLAVNCSTVPEGAADPVIAGFFFTA